MQFVNASKDDDDSDPLYNPLNTKGIKNAHKMSRQNEKDVIKAKYEGFKKGQGKPANKRHPQKKQGGRHKGGDPYYQFTDGSREPVYREEARTYYIIKNEWSQTRSRAALLMTPTGDCYLDCEANPRTRVINAV